MYLDWASELIWMGGKLVVETLKVPKTFLDGEPFSVPEICVSFKVESWLIRFRNVSERLINFVVSFSVKKLKQNLCASLGDLLYFGQLFKAFGNI